MSILSLAPERLRDLRAALARPVHIDRVGLQAAVLAFALVATTACGDSGPTSNTLVSPQAAVAGGPSAAKGKPTAVTPDGKGIGTLEQTGVQRTRYRVEFHLGQVMTSTSNVYLIWYGNWANDPAPLIIQDLVIGLGGSPYFTVNTLYPDASGAAPSGGLIFGGAVNDLYSRGPTLSDQDIKDIVLEQMAVQSIPVDPRGIYVVLTTPDVTASSGWADRYCAFHDFVMRNGGSHKIVYVGSPRRSPSRCAPQLTGPNGDYNADGMASLVAAELFNATVDPVFNAYYDKLGLEPADKCAWSYGETYTTPNGARANVRLGSRDFLLQQLWVPTKKGGQCALARP
jgi:hypothetical protein